VFFTLKDEYSVSLALNFYSSIGTRIAVRVNA